MIYINEILGGIMIGTASALPLLWEGRIAGISGYAASSLRPKDTQSKTALTFVLGLIVGGIVWRIMGRDNPLPLNPELPVYVWIIAGLLVGFGSRLGGGCTSGHGVCGLGRLSHRSFASVMLFVLFAMITTFVMRKII